MRRPPPVVMLLSLSTLAAPLSAQRLFRLEMGAAGGYHTFGSKLELNSAVGGAVRAGYWFHTPFSFEAAGTFSSPTTNTSLKKGVSAKTIGFWLLDNFRIGTTNTVFLKAGYGRINFGACPSVSVPGSGPCGAANMLQGGLGTRISLNPTLFMRYEVEVSRGLTALKFSNVSLQGGVSLMLGSKPLLDVDGDGVFDRYDRCPETRLGALVDKRGCSADQDSDGVPDGLDRCPNTAEGATVDGAGCPRTPTPTASWTASTGAPIHRRARWWIRQAAPAIPIPTACWTASTGAR